MGGVLVLKAAQDSMSVVAIVQEAGYQVVHCNDCWLVRLRYAYRSRKRAGRKWKVTL